MAKEKLRAFMRRGLDAERDAIKAKQKVQIRKKRLAGILAKKKKKVTKKKNLLAKEKAALKARIAMLPKTFTAAMCGEVGAKGLAARVLCLERLKMYSPKLDLEREVGWDGMKREIARKEFFLRCVGLSSKGSIGHAFVAEIHRVVTELKAFYEGPSSEKKKSKGLVADGDPQAFAKFFDKFHGFVKKCATSVSL